MFHFSGGLLRGVVALFSKSCSIKNTAGATTPEPEKTSPQGQAQSLFNRALRRSRLTLRHTRRWLENRLTPGTAPEFSRSGRVSESGTPSSSAGLGWVSRLIGQSRRSSGSPAAKQPPFAPYFQWMTGGDRPKAKVWGSIEPFEPRLMFAAQLIGDSHETANLTAIDSALSLNAPAQTAIPSTSGNILSVATASPATALAGAPGGPGVAGVLLPTLLNTLNQ